ncbi:MAG: SDR family NAD(P)-dependent oxidoreductase [bacterium]
MCIGFARAGYTVFITGRNEKRLQQASAEISAVGKAPVQFIQADVSLPEACIEMIEKIRSKAKRFDVLVNNAAYFEKGDALRFQIDRWQKMLDTNISGPYFCARAFAKEVIKLKTGGCIINISSIASTLSVHGYSAYSASKAALDNLTKSLALEWAQYGIRVNGVAPGHTLTEGIRQAIKSDELNLGAIETSTPLGRIAEPEEIAELVLFLASEKAKYITGQTIRIDGGRSVDGSFHK